MYAPLIGTGPTQGRQAPCTDDALQWTAAVQAFFLASGVSGAYQRAIRVVLCFGNTVTQSPRNMCRCFAS